VRVDVHNHFYPLKFLEKLERDGRSAGIIVERDEWNRQILVQNGTRVVTITPPMADPERRIEDMDRTGIDQQVLTLSVPSVDVFPPGVGEEMARLVNDEVAAICRRYPERFVGFGTLPFLDPAGTVRELVRCIEDLGFRGVCIGSNINGIGLDSPLLSPFYEHISGYGLPIHIHPRAPLDRESYRDYRMGPMLGFEVDLCIAVIRLVMGGVLERFPRLTFIVSHLGGAIPYLAERVQNCYEAYPECQVNISRPAMDYLRTLYYDTVSFFEPALMCAHAFVGADHMILGSDYPHVIGDIDEAVTSIENLDVPEADKQRIFSENLLGLMKPGGMD
jgi:aminocarboxymuconate-semialdehyde decarboxylase